MKFTLIYDGDLPASGNSSKPAVASSIRNQLHDQLDDLWKSHVVLRQLARTARTVPWKGAGYLTGGPVSGQTVNCQTTKTLFPSCNPVKPIFAPRLTCLELAHLFHLFANLCIFRVLWI